MASYPSEIIPKPGYRIIDSEQLNRIENIFLVRRALKSSVEKDRFGHIMLDSLLPEGKEGFFYDLSWNLLGVFKSSYVKYNVRCEDWYPGKLPLDVTQIESPERLSITDNPPLYLKFSLIQNFPFTYKKPEQDEQLTKVIVEHKPTVANFWHFQFAVYETDISPCAPVKPEHKGWRYTSLVSNGELKIMLLTKTGTEEPAEAVCCPDELYK